MFVRRDRLVRRVRDVFARPGDPPAGYSVYSEANDRRFEHWVWSPPGAGDRPLPLVLVLHGVNDASGFVWWQKGRAQEAAADLVRSGAVPPFLLVLATDGGRGWGSAYVDWADGSSLMETHIVHELLPWLRRTFPLSETAHICGNSMGGYGSFLLALRHPGTFASVSAMSAYLRPRSRLSEDTHDRATAMYGSEARRAEHDPHRLAADPAAVAGMRIAFDCGVDDRLLDESRGWHQRLVELGIEHQYRELPGGHTWPYWRDRLPAHLRFHLAGAAI